MAEDFERIKNFSSTMTDLDRQEWFAFKDVEGTFLDKNKDLILFKNKSLK